MVFLLKFIINIAVLNINYSNVYKNNIIKFRLMEENVWLYSKEKVIYNFNIKLKCTQCIKLFHIGNVCDRSVPLTCLCAFLFFQILIQMQIEYL